MTYQVNKTLNKNIGKGRLEQGFLSFYFPILEISLLQYI